MKSIPSSFDLRQSNKQRVLKYVYENEVASKQNMSQDLTMSLPTVTQNLKDWEDEGLIEKEGLFESTGGRKAQIYHFVAKNRVAIGVAILKETYHIVIIDLYGRPIKSAYSATPYKHEQHYYQSIGKHIEEIVKEAQINEDSILGVIIAIQGLVSSDGKTVIYSKILDCNSHEPFEFFTKYVKYPCLLMHDTEASALAESWSQKKLKNAVLIYLNRYFGGAVIIDGKVYQGKTLSSSIIEHMTLFPGGIKCYCGKKGCIESYCSVQALQRNAGENLDTFFLKLRTNDKKAIKVWNEYLRNLAIAINNIRMLMDTEYIIGGDLLRYMIDEDFELLEDYIQAECPFNTDKITIKRSIYSEEAAAFGAGIVLIKEFIGTLFE